MGNVKYYYCTICGNIIEVVKDSGNTPMCCMRDMEELTTGTTDGKFEYHIPVYKCHKKRIEICVGKEPHPMEAQHYIEWIEIETNKGIMRRFLKPGEEPCVHFRLCEGEKPITIYSYCNKHKLWKCNCNEECSDD